MQGFQNVIDTFIELDNANTVAILLPEFEWYIFIHLRLWGVVF